MKHSCFRLIFALNSNNHVVWLGSANCGTLNCPSSHDPPRSLSACAKWKFERTLQSYTSTTSSRCEPASLYAKKKRDQIWNFTPYTVLSHPCQYRTSSATKRTMGELGDETWQQHLSLEESAQLAHVVYHYVHPSSHVCDACQKFLSQEENEQSIPSLIVEVYEVRGRKLRIRLCCDSSVTSSICLCSIEASDITILPWSTTTSRPVPSPPVPYPLHPSPALEAKKTNKPYAGGAFTIYDRSPLFKRPINLWVWEIFHVQSICYHIRLSAPNASNRDLMRKTNFLPTSSKQNCDN